MAIELICQGCSRKLRVEEQHAGKQARCPECGTVMPVTASAVQHSRGDAVRPDPSALLSAAPPSSDNPFAPSSSSTPSPPSSPSSSAPSSSAPSSSAPSSLSEPRFAPLSPAKPGRDDASGRWMLRTDNGQAYGPIARSELDAWVQQGRVSATSYIAQEGAAQWQRAGEVYPQLNPLRSAGSANPWADGVAAGGAWPAPGQGSAAGGLFNPYARGGYKRPHRGTLVLVLGSLSWVICFLFGIVAFAMGQADLSAMRRGEMDDSGRGMTQAGMYLGLAHLILMLGVIGFMVLSAVVGDM